MLVPVASVGRSGLVPVSRRLHINTLGYVAGGLFVGLVLFAASHGSVVILILGTLVGVIVGRHIENESTAVLRQHADSCLSCWSRWSDSYAQLRIDPALEQFWQHPDRARRARAGSAGLALVAPSREASRAQATASEGE